MREKLGSDEFISMSTRGSFEFGGGYAYGGTVAGSISRAMVGRGEGVFLIERLLSIGATLDQSRMNGMDSTWQWDRNMPNRPCRY